MKKNVKVVVRGSIRGSGDERGVYLLHAPGVDSPTWTYEQRLATMFETQDEAIAACAEPLRLGVAVSLEYVKGEQ